MTISPLYSNSAFSVYSRNAPSSDVIKQISNIANSNSSLQDKYISSEKNNQLASDQIENKTTTYINYAYQTNVQLNKLNRTEKNYSNLQKNSLKSTGQDKFSDFMDYKNVEESLPKEQTTGKGYYIVLSHQNTSSDETHVKSLPKNSRKNRIADTYHLKYDHLVGTLVDLVL